MIVGAVVMCWLACVVVICAAMKRVTQPPWWETLLLELDRIDLVGEPRPDSAQVRTRFR